MAENISNIPPELVEIVARFAEPQDLFALRLVCRETKNKVENFFEKVYFSSFAVLIHYEKSLETLLAVSKHARYSRTVKKVFFCVDDFVEVDYTPASPESGTSHSDKTTVRKRQSILRGQKRMWERNTDLNLLTRIFTNFASVGNIIEIRITAKDEDAGKAPLRPWGAKVLEACCGPISSLGTHGSDRPPEIVVKAIKRSRFPVQKLSVLHDRWFETLLDMCSLDSFYSDLKFALATLTHLEMSANWEWADRCSGKTQRLAWLLEDATSLVSFKLSSMIHDHDEWRVEQSSAFVKDFLRPPHPDEKLQECSLEGVVIDGFYLCNFIKRCSAFRSLRLENVRLYCGDWSELSSEYPDGAHCDIRQREATSYVKSTAGIDDVTLVKCFTRRGQMPEFHKRWGE